MKEKLLKKLKDELDFCQKPIFFFDDDADGATSFIQMYKYKQEGKGIIFKTSPRVTKQFAQKVEEYGADKVFILDLAMVDQEFVDEVKVPIVWVDHHELQEVQGNVFYLNPKKWGKSTPPSVLIYEALQGDLWLSVIGAIGDWHNHPNMDEFDKKYPDLTGDFEYAEDFLFKTKIGELAKMLSFNLKGTTQSALKSVIVFTRIETPYEILNKETSKGKYIYKKYEKVNQNYEELKQKALKEMCKENFFVFTYTSAKMSVTKDLSNELIALHPDKIIIVAREKSGQMKMSIRAGRNAPIVDQALAKALSGIDGYGGGHDKACGGNIAKEDWDVFLKNFKRELGIR